MPNTTNGLPYPALTDAPDVPYWVQQLADAVDAKTLAQPRAKIVMAAATQSTASGGATTTLDFAGGTVTYDNDGMASIATDSLTIQTAGYYVFTARVAFAANAAGYRSLLITRGATDFLADDLRAATPTQACIMQISSEPVLCAVGDVITVKVSQTSGGALNVGPANARNAYLAGVWVGGQ